MKWYEKNQASAVGMILVLILALSFLQGKAHIDHLKAEKEAKETIEAMIKDYKKIKCTYKDRESAYCVVDKYSHSVTYLCILNSPKANVSTCKLRNIKASF